MKTYRERMQEVITLREQAITLIAEADELCRNMLAENEAEGNTLLTPVEHSCIDYLIQEIGSNTHIGVDGHSHDRVAHVFPGVIAHVRSIEDCSKLFPRFEL